MELEQIKQIFPEGYISKDDKFDNHNVYIEIESSKFVIPKSSISLREEILLENIFKESFIHNELHQSYWQKYLWNEPVKQPENGTYRVIQFKLLLKDETLAIHDWISTLKNSFENCQDAFFYEQNCVLLIEKKSESIFTNDEIFSIIETMDSDFYTQTKLFFGNFWSDLATFPRLFQEELILFNNISPFMKSSSYKNLSQSVFTSFVAKLSYKDNLILSKIKSEINALKWANSLINALWSSQNNISIASQKLFLHRNTMIYRMDKFQEKTGFQLKKNDDLLLCYIVNNLQ